MRWFIIKDPQRHHMAAYVQVPGSKKSYGPKATARTFTTREQAERERCGNEIILEMSA